MSVSAIEREREREDGRKRESTALRPASRSSAHVETSEKKGRGESERGERGGEV